MYDVDPLILALWNVDKNGQTPVNIFQDFTVPWTRFIWFIYDNCDVWQWIVQACACTRITLGGLYPVSTCTLYTLYMHSVDMHAFCINCLPLKWQSYLFLHLCVTANVTYDVRTVIDNFMWCHVWTQQCMTFWVSSNGCQQNIPKISTLFHSIPLLETQEWRK